jgi:4-diphosphocytidyl-2-C-methyl-D-erythritol kinase
LNEYLELNLSSSQLKTYASQIGSDCAFFIDNVPQYATGRGEVLNKFKLSLSDYKIVIVNPGVHINTAEAYRDFAQTGMYSEPGQVIKAIEKPLTDWKEHLKNDFEKVVFKKNPSIEKLKNTLYQHGAIYASMSGSGSSVFGLFHKNYRTDNISRLFSDYHCFISSELM